MAAGSQQRRQKVGVTGTPKGRVIIVDSTVWIDALNGVDSSKADWLRANVQTQPVAVCDLVLCEVLRGINDPRDFEVLDQRLAVFPQVSAGGQEIAVLSARNYQSLRRRGITVRKTVDCMIATLCIREGHTLLHNDRDFDPFEKHLGLKVLHV